MRIIKGRAVERRIEARERARVDPPGARRSSSPRQARSPPPPSRCRVRAGGGEGESSVPKAAGANRPMASLLGTRASGASFRSRASAGSDERRRVCVGAVMAFSASGRERSELGKID